MLRERLAKWLAAKLKPTVCVCFGRLKRPAHRKRKYGLLSNQDEVEMEAVESDEDDDTLYEARSLRRSEVNSQPHTQQGADGKCSAVTHQSQQSADRLID